MLVAELTELETVIGLELLFVAVPGRFGMVILILEAAARPDRYRGLSRAYDR